MTRRVLRSSPQQQASLIRAQASVREDEPTDDMDEVVSAFEQYNAGVEAGFREIGQTIDGLAAGLNQHSADLAAARMGGAGRRGVVGISDRERQAQMDQFAHYARTGLRPQASMSTDSNTDGGYVVPDAVEQQLSTLLRNVSPLRKLASSIRVSSGIYRKAVRLGGSGVGWVGEKDSRPETVTPTLSELTYEVNEQYGNFPVTANLLDDANVDVANLIIEEASLTLAEQESLAFATGDGNKKPAGIVGSFYPKVDNAAWAWGKLGYIVTGNATGFPATSATVSPLDSLQKVVFGLRAGYRVNARWVFNSNTAAALSTVKDAVNGTYIWQRDPQSGMPDKLLGYPVELCEDFPDLGANNFPIAFGDFARGYIVVDRQNLTVLRDPYTKKPYVLFYCTRRLTGGVQDFAAIKLLKCSV